MMRVPGFSFCFIYPRLETEETRNPEILTGIVEEDEEDEEGGGGGGGGGGNNKALLSLSKRQR